MTAEEPQVDAPPEKPHDRVGWVKLYHPKGPDVRLPVPANDPAQALAYVSAALEAGWLVIAPGLDAGEEKELVGWVLRGAHEHEGKTTPFVLLYSTNDALKWSFLKVYLNTVADVEAFEYSSRLKLDALPDYVGNDKPQRGASTKTDKFLIAPPRPFEVVFKKNPKHDPNTEEGKLKPARLFVRWMDQRPEKPAEAPQPAQDRPKEAAPTTITIPQYANLCDEMDARGFDMPRLKGFCAHYHVAELRLLPAIHYDHCLAAIKKWPLKAEKQAQPMVPEEIPY